MDRKDVSQEEKLKLYHQILQKYLLYKDKAEPMTVKVMAEPTPMMSESHTTALPVAAAAAVEERPQESMEAEIIQSAPKNLRHKASVLLR